MPIDTSCFEGAIADMNFFATRKHQGRNFLIRGHSKKSLKAAMRFFFNPVTLEKVLALARYRNGYLQDEIVKLPEFKKVASYMRLHAKWALIIENEQDQGVLDFLFRFTASISNIKDLKDSAFRYKNIAAFNALHDCKMLGMWSLHPFATSLDERDFYIATTIFIREKVDIYHVDPSQKNFIHYAALVGNIRLVREIFRLLKAMYPANAEKIIFDLINQKDSKGNTPLRLSIELDHDEFSKMLIDEKADIDLSDNKGLSPLFAAVQLKQHSAVKLLLESGAKIEVSSQASELSCLESSIALEDKEMMELLLEYDRNEENRAKTLLFAAVNGDEEMVRFLINEKGS